MDAQADAAEKAKAKAALAAARKADEEVLAAKIETFKKAQAAELKEYMEGGGHAKTLSDRHNAEDLYFGWKLYKEKTGKNDMSKSDYETFVNSPDGKAWAAEAAKLIPIHLCDINIEKQVTMALKDAASGWTFKPKKTSTSGNVHRAYVKADAAALPAIKATLDKVVVPHKDMRGVLTTSIGDGVVKLSCA